MFTGPFHVTQMDEENPALPAELSNQRFNVLTHKLEVSLAESTPVGPYFCTFRFSGNLFFGHD
jgi:hypothetical protein